jgi:hypothetical protein
MTTLFVEFCGEQSEVLPPTEFSFGRMGTLRIDDNTYLHRVMGTFTWRNDMWWLTNVGAHLPMHVEGCVGGSSITLSPGSAIPLVFGSSFIRFAAGGTSYEIRVDPPSVDGGATKQPFDGDGEPTVDAAELPLSPEQWLLIVALAESRLRKGVGADLPTNEDVAARFGWTMTKFNRKLDNICLKFHRKGVAGLVKTSTRPAKNRRGTLVDHVITSGLVTVDQLVLLPPRPPRQPRSTHSAQEGSTPPSPLVDGALSSVEPTE